MIVSLRGTLAAALTDSAVVECAGVGYGLAISLHTREMLPPPGAEVYLLVATLYSQDTVRLFGFVDAEERVAFQLLLATSGVGPRLALTILSALTPNQLYQVIRDQDKQVLTRIPGVGHKKAARLLVDLQDRLPTNVVFSAVAKPNHLLIDVASALLNLGFDKNVAGAAAQLALQSLPSSQEIPLLVRTALRQITAPSPLLQHSS